MPIGSSCVHQEIQDMPTESSDVYQELQRIITSKSRGIPVSCLETRYKENFHRSLDYNSLGVKTLNELLFKMCNENKVMLYKDEETHDAYVMSARWLGDEILFEDISKLSLKIKDMPTDSSVVYKEIQDALACFPRGIPVSCSSWLERRYHQEFNKSVDYKSLSVKNIEELIDKMLKEGRALLCEDPESKKSYVMCADLVESLHELLKHNVEKLLFKHDGEIELSSFEREYKDMFKAKLKYHHYGLTGFDHLRKVLHLEEADSQGKKVIKAGKYNLRKRKNWMKI